METSHAQHDTSKEAFFILAELFKAPDDDLFQALSTGDLENQLNTIFDSVSLRKNVSFQHKPKDLNGWRDIHFRCFSGFKKPFAAPIESVYKPWTNDPDASVPFARDKGLIMGDSAMHIHYLLKSFELEIPEEFEHTPDHLSILLELGAYFLEHSDVSFTIQFIDDHFDWLDDFIIELRKVDNSDFYIEVATAVKHVTSHTRRLMLQ